MKANRLLKLLKASSAADIAALDAEIAAAEASLNAMRSLRQIMSTHLKTGGGNRPPSCSAEDLGDAENISEKRRQIVAKYLLAAGTAKAITLAKHCGLENLTGFHFVLRSPWFRTKGELVELTDEGKLAAAKF
jgi:hypothetical protein